MTPEKLKQTLQTAYQYLLVLRDYLVLPVWTWLDNKKTAFGAGFFFVQDWIIVPYYEKVAHAPVPADLAFAMSVLGAVFTLTGVAHKGTKLMITYMRKGADNAQAKDSAGTGAGAGDSSVN